MLLELVFCLLLLAGLFLVYYHYYFLHHILKCQHRQLLYINLQAYFAGIYGEIVCIFSLGIFLESIWTKVLQSQGDMKTPMIAQVVGAVVNVILDPILIFGVWKIEPMGVAGAAIATVFRQYSFQNYWYKFCSNNIYSYLSYIFYSTRKDKRKYIYSCFKRGCTFCASCLDFFFCWRVLCLANFSYYRGCNLCILLCILC